MTSTPGLPPARRTGAPPLRRMTPAFLALVVLGGLYEALTGALSPGPRGVVLALGVISSVAYTLLHRRQQHDMMRRLTWAVLVLLTAALAASVALLLEAVVSRRENAPSLLRDAGVIWAANVLTFAWWYWALDDDGPGARHVGGYRARDLLFPQLTRDDQQGWQPEFVDYLFLAFTASTAFSPTDTLILSRRFKGLVMLQALLSLLLIGVILARAVNTL